MERRFPATGLDRRGVAAGGADRPAGADPPRGSGCADRARLQRPAADRGRLRRLAALARDGLIESQPRHGWRVIGPRIPWISRLRPLSEEPHETTTDAVEETEADDVVANALEIPVGSPVAERRITLRGASGEVWGFGVSRYPLGTPLRGGDPGVLLAKGEIDYDDVE